MERFEAIRRQAQVEVSCRPGSGLARSNELTISPDESQSREPEAENEKRARLRDVAAATATATATSSATVWRRRAG